MLNKWAQSARISICTEFKRINYLSSEKSVGSKNYETKNKSPERACPLMMRTILRVISSCLMKSLFFCCASYF